MKKLKKPGLFFLLIISIFLISGKKQFSLFIHSINAQTANVVTITSPSTANAVVNRPFNFTVTSNPPATNFTASQLPDGLSINSNTGIISGTPQTIGNFSGITLSAGNGNNNGTQNFTLTITSAEEGEDNNNNTPNNQAGGCALIH